MLPEAFLDRMKIQLGAEYSAFLESLKRPRAVALRFNPLKGDETPSLPFVGDSVPWEPMGYYYDPNSRPGLHPYHDAGVYYLQEASAMAPVQLLDPQPGERVCDLCASPGGKSTQIAGRLKGEGFLLCNEWSPKRAKILSQNIERLGVANAVVTNEDTKHLAERYPEYFDKVLIDAPCSGEGMFRKEEAAVTDWSQETVGMCAARQAEILDAGAELVREGGLLVYSTCTFAPEEKEMTVAAFLQRHPEFTPEKREAPWFAETENGGFRLWPHKLRGEGHFAACLRKTGREQPASNQRKPEGKLPRPWEEFAKNMGISLPEGSIVTFGDRLFWAPVEMPDIHGVRVLRPGLELGEVKKDRFEPAHALALWLKDAAVTLNLPAEDPRLTQYLHGDVIPCDAKGWCLVQVDGYSLGWGKADGKVLKNHYPKGLRR